MDVSNLFDLSKAMNELSQHMKNKGEFDEASQKEINDASKQLDIELSKLNNIAKDGAFEIREFLKNNMK